MAPIDCQKLARFLRRNIWDRVPEDQRERFKYEFIPGVLAHFKSGALRIETFGPFAGDEEGQRIIDGLVGINAFRRTELCELMRIVGSDKGLSRHNYTAVYASLFAGLRSRPLRFFELGIGTNNPALPSTMGAAGRPGASLRGWSRFFPEAQIFAADIDRQILFREPRITTFFCDQTNPDSVRALWSAPELGDDFDVIVEDGLHTFEANLVFLEGSLHKLKRSGLYIIEDVSNSDLPRWRDLLSRDGPVRHDHSYCIATIPWITTIDNSLVIARRAP